MEVFIQASPATYEKGLAGSLLIIHGTQDEHCQNLEYLVKQATRNAGLPKPY